MSWKRWAVSLLWLAAAPLPLREIQWEGLRRLNAEPLLQKCALETGEEVSISRLEEFVDCLYETGEFLERPQYELEPLEDGVRLRVRVREFPVLTRILWSGNAALTAYELDEYLGLEPGQPLNRKALEEGLQRVLKAYEEQGYFLTQIQSVQVEEELGILRVHLVEPRISQILVEGLRKTRPYIIRVVLRTQVGDLVNAYRIQRDMYELWNLGIFEEIPQWRIERTEDPERVKLVITVQEGRTGRLNFGGGYSDTTGFVFQASVSEQNFRGTAQAVQFQLSIGSRVNTFFLDWFDPIYRRRNQRLRLTAFRTENLLDLTIQRNAQPVQATYSVLETGGRVSLSVRFQEVFYYRISFGSRNQRLLLQNGEGFTEEELYREGFSEGTVNSISHALRMDTRLDIFDPFAGTFVEVTHAIGLRYLGGDFSYQKVTLDFREYIPLASRNRWVLAFRILIGRATDRVPALEQFYMGGSETVRGYNFGEQRGLKAGLFNLEVRWRGSPLGAAVFLDAGSAVPADQPLRLKDALLGAGFGVRIKIPQLAFLPVRLDIGYNLRDGGSQTHFGFGQVF